MTLKRSHMIGALGGALTMTAIMAVPAYADTLTDATTNEESILYTESWNDKAAATWKVTQTSACPRPQIPGRPAFFCRAMQ